MRDRARRRVARHPGAARLLQHHQEDAQRAAGRADPADRRSRGRSTRRSRYQNALRNRFDHDYVVVHDPQPLPLVVLPEARAVDLALPHRPRPSPTREILRLPDRLRRAVRRGHRQRAGRTASRWARPAGLPAGDRPFSIINRELPDGEVDRRLPHYGVPPDLPAAWCRSRASTRGRTRGRDRGASELARGGRATAPGAGRQRAERRPGGPERLRGAAGAPARTGSSS